MTTATLTAPSVNSQAIAWLITTLQLEGVVITWWTPEEAGDEVGLYQRGEEHIYINSAWKEDPFLVEILTHEFIHYLQDSYELFFAEIIGDEVHIPTIGYKGPKDLWEEHLISLEYHLPDMGYSGDIIKAIEWEAPAYILQDSYTKVREWYERWKYDGINKW